MSNLSFAIIDRFTRNIDHGRDPLDGIKTNTYDRARVSISNGGNAIMSYGWWEMARILRDKSGAPVRWLINGDTYSVTTSRQQAEVRGAISRTGIPSVIVPYSVLEEAGIDLNTVIALDVTPDTTEETVITKTENPGRWEYDGDTRYDDYGGWQNTLTGEIVLRENGFYGTQKPRIECTHDLGPQPSMPYGWTYEGTYENPQYLADLAAYNEAVSRHTAHMRLRHGEWEEFTHSMRQTGRKHIVSGPNGRTKWDMVWDDETQSVVYERIQRRHWLGESLIQAGIRYTANIKCRRCAGTGEHDGDTRAKWGTLHGPKVEWEAEYRPNEPLTGTYEVPSCNDCSGRGRRTVTRTRTARFLSGFDRGETRPSYFFCELPKASTATTVEQAYEDLKPATVKTAEQLGREVKRQGDIFAVPLASLTTADIRKSGAAIHKGEHILGTNHKATEVARLNGMTLVRGTLSHDPANRRPDHKRVTVGKGWHLAVKNTVPTAV